MTRREVLQVGDTADVGSILATGLAQHTDWCVRAQPLTDPMASTKWAKLVEVPSRGLTARRATTAAVAGGSSDVVHVHWARYAPFIARMGTPLVVHAHGSDVRDRRRTIQGRLVDRALRRADLVLVSTPDLLAEVPDGALYLPNPVMTDVFVPPGERTEENRPTILLFARLIEIKGASVLIDAARRIRLLQPDVRILAVRGGTHDDEALAAGVELIDPLGRAQLARLLASVDLVIGQQHLGALGLSELEAMSCARAVVTKVHNGLYENDLPIASASGAEELAATSVQLILDAGRATEIGARARAWVTANHDVAVVCRRLVTLYETLL